MTDRYDLIEALARLAEQAADAEYERLADEIADQASQEGQ